MKRAVFYARVSTESQKDEGTIESQIAALRKQVIEAGNVLVKEYADNGYSGAKMDRPALEQLRKDLKTELFDVVYFHNTDRIARDVTYQNLIITEILKYKKQVVINGKDYVHNPENKFELTVLGAVSELERAKMLERSQRGKQHRLRQGFLLSYGYNVYGYTYVPRSDNAPAELAIKENEAKIVRYIFETYASRKSSWTKIVRSLENMGAVTKTGKKHWPVHTVKQILKNSTYSGIRYFNTCRHVKTESHPLRKIKYGKKDFRDRSEWIAVKVPAIVSQKMFDEVQERIATEKQKYRKPREVKLLSNLVRCGECGRFCVAYHRYMRHYYKYKGVTVKVSGNVYYKSAYKCNRRYMDRVHIKSLDIKRCTNPEVSTRVLEPIVWQLIETTMLQPARLKKCLTSAEARIRSTQLQMEKELKALEEREQHLKTERRMVLDRYATGNLNKDKYVEQSLWFDNEANKLKLERTELIKRIPILHSKDVIDVSLRIFCETTRVRFEKCTNFEIRRQFLLDFIEEVVYVPEKITVKGFMPVQLPTYATDQTGETNRIEFRIEGNKSE